MTFALRPNDPRVHVFALRPGQVRLARRTYLSRGQDGPDDTPLAEAFGAPVDAAHVEVFGLSDIAPLGLRDYLAQAHDIPQAALAPDRARLDAVRGVVAILAPRAVRRVDALAPVPQLEPVGSYAPEGVDDAPRPLPRDGRRAATGRARPAAGRGLARSTILWIAAAALVLAGLGVLVP